MTQGSPFEVAHRGLAQTWEVGSEHLAHLCPEPDIGVVPSADLVEDIVPRADQGVGERLLQSPNDISPLNMPRPVLRLSEQRTVGDEIERGALFRGEPGALLGADEPGSGSC